MFFAIKKITKTFYLRDKYLFYFADIHIGSQYMINNKIGLFVKAGIAYDYLNYKDEIKNSSGVITTDNDNTTKLIYSTTEIGVTFNF